jgi:hypothetical protein
LSFLPPICCDQIKAKLDDMRASIESVHGPLPEDLQDEARSAAGSAGTSAANSPGGPSESAGTQQTFSIGFTM